jgi:hypothetical protein
MPVRFVEAAPNSGFDSSQDPPWLMVPRDGLKEVHFLGGSDYLVVSSEPNIAKVVESLPQISVPGAASVVSLSNKTVFPTPQGPVRRLWISGEKPGTALIAALKKGGKIEARLDVEVMPQWRVKTAFFSIRDLKGRRCTRTAASLPSLVADANNILRPQTNVVITQVGTTDKVDIPRDLGNPIRLREASAWVEDVKPSRNSRAHFNVFFVWSVTRAVGGDLNALTDTTMRCCLMEDTNRARDAAVLAHETLHLLLGAARGHNHAYRTELLSPDGGGTRIRRADAIAINQAAARLP